MTTKTTKTATTAIQLRQRKASHPRSARKAVEVLAIGEPHRSTDTGAVVTFVPLQIKRRKMRRLLVPPSLLPTATTFAASSGAPETNIDLPLLKTIGKAFYWQKLIDDGVYATSSEIAARFKVDRGWVSEVMRLTRLAPDIIEAISNGQQPRDLTLDKLRRKTSMIWVEQVEEFLS
jgi:hypothetical protein